MKEISLEKISLKISDFDVPENDPFANDRFNLKEYAEKLTKIINSTSQPLVIVLNSQWGTGKTKFINMWQGQLNKDRHHSLYLNAWENDYLEEPMVMLISEFNNYISSKTITPKFDATSVDAMKKAGIKAVKHGLPLLSGLLAGDLAKYPVQKFLQMLSDSLSKELLKEYEARKSNFQFFRNSLKKFTEKNSMEKPFVIFVDELDRCKPTYTVKLLERIKHLFSVNNIVFVLAVDKNQLNMAIQCCYGDGIDSEGYLKKLFDYEFVLPEPSRKYFCSDVLNKILILDDVCKRNDDVREWFYLLSEKYQLTLREIEKTASYLSLSVVLGKSALMGSLTHMLLTFLVMKVKFPDIYTQLFDNKPVLKRLINELVFDDKLEHSRSAAFSLNCFIESSLIFARLHFEDGVEVYNMHKLQSDNYRKEKNPQDKVGEYSSKIVDYLTFVNDGKYHNANIMRDCISFIDLAGRS